MEKLPSHFLEGRVVGYKHDMQGAEVPHCKDRQLRVQLAQIFDRWHQPGIVESLRILEIGVAEGGSLLMWQYLWPWASIVGVDLDIDQISSDTKALLETRNIKLVKMSMPTRDIWNLGSFDLIIDDGGHGYDLVSKTFELCWPLVLYGGLYIIEDWHLAVHQPERIAAMAARAAVGTDNGEHWCDGEFPADSADHVEVYRRAIAIFKRR